jgi:bacitracin resistance protein BacA
MRCASNTCSLPVSSTGHLTIAEGLLGLQVDDPGVTAFTAIIQVGAIVAVIIYFRSDIGRLASAWLRGLVNGQAREAPDYRFAWYVILGLTPIGIVRFLAQGVISGPLRNLWVVVVAVVGWSAVMWIAERVGKRDRPESSLNMRDAVIIGLVQCVALIPECVSFRGNHQRAPVAGSGPGRGNAAGVLSRHSGSGCRRGVRGDQGSLRDQCGGRLVAHLAGNGGQLCRRVRVNRLVAAIRGQTQHHGVHLVSRVTGGRHRRAARHRAAEPDVDTGEPSTDTSRPRLNAGESGRA